MIKKNKNFEIFKQFNEDFNNLIHLNDLADKCASSYNTQEWNPSKKKQKNDDFIIFLNRKDEIITNISNFIKIQFEKIYEITWNSSNPSIELNNESIDLEWSIYPLNSKDESKFNFLSNFVHKMRQKNIYTRDLMFKIIENNKKNHQDRNYEEIQKIYNHPYCLFCSMELENTIQIEEDFYHLFFDCPKSKIITNNLKSKINILSKSFFKKEFPENLYWFSTENNKPDAQSLFHNFNDYFGAVGFIPKKLFENLNVLSTSKKLKQNFMKSVMKLTIENNYEKFKEHR